MKPIECDASTGKTEYEKLRDSIMRRNAIVLKSLGLPSFESKTPAASVVAKLPCKLGSASTLPQAAAVAKLPASTSPKLASSFVVKLPSSASSKPDLVEIPTYNQIFCPPPQRYKEPGKLYGKEVLRKYFYSQYLTLMTNGRIMKGWLVDRGLFDNPPNLKDAGANIELKKFIEERQSDLAALNFGSTTYKWQPKEMYETIKEMLHYARRKMNSSANDVVQDANNADGGVQEV